MLWPGMPERSARQNLRQIIYNLRQSIPEVAIKPTDKVIDDNNKENRDSLDPKNVVPLLNTNRQTIQLNPLADVIVDVGELENLLRKVQVHKHVDLLTCHACRQKLFLYHW